MVHDVCNCVIHGHSIWPKLCVCLLVGRAKAHKVPMCSPLGRRAKGPPSFAESNGHTNHTQFMPDSYPNHAPPHSPCSAVFCSAVFSIAHCPFKSVVRAHSCLACHFREAVRLQDFSPVDDVLIRDFSPQAGCSSFQGHLELSGACCHDLHSPPSLTLL